jgi:hypothetical protein
MTESRALSVLIPVFDDWSAAARLVAELDEVLAEDGRTADLLVVDDGSIAAPPARLMEGTPKAFRRIRVLSLRKNLGHQRALCVGFVHLYTEGQTQPIVVMDADGEDSPRDVLALLQRFTQHDGSKAVFAARAKRAEKLTFRISYRLFQAVHYFLVGFGTRIGNFSVLPPAVLGRLVVAPELWNHYAAAVVKSNFPADSVPIARAKRVGGVSKMGFVGLVVHGLSAMSVYGERVGVRLLVLSCALVLLAALGVVAAVTVRLGTSLAIPGWATSATGLLLIVVLQGFMISLAFTFLILHSRAAPAVLPLRDCPLYVDRVRTVFPLDG